MEESEIYSLQQLYDIMEPAILYKTFDLKRKGYDNIEVKDLWNYLSEFKWAHSHNLHLYEMVDDIHELTFKDVYDFLKSKAMKSPNYHIVEKHLSASRSDHNEKQI